MVFAEDPFLSRRHAAITMDRESMRFALRDLGSSNGTAIRVAASACCSTAISSGWDAICFASI